MCGIDPARFTLAAARLMGATRGTVLGEATSADAEPRVAHRTVGYAAVALHS
jgi:AmmeMemoRadiSam system protein B